VSAATEQVEEKAQVEAGTEVVDKAVDETKAAVDETKKIKPKKAAIEGC
jgi:hypothetical protein